MLGALNYQNLDEIEEFVGRNTTTEFLAKTVFDRMAARIRDGQLGDSALGIESLRVTLHESHVAWASFEGKLG